MGMTDDNAILSFDEHLSTLKDEVQRISGQLEIDIDVLHGKGIQNIATYAKLSPYILINNQLTSFGYASCTDSEYDEIKFFYPELIK